MTILDVYKRYPFAIPARVKFFNIFRLPFRLSALERFLIRRIEAGRSTFWKKFIPPIYFFNHGAIRETQREGINYRLDLSKQLDHAIYFYTVRDFAWDNLLAIVRPDFRIIDAGANIGYLTLQFARRCGEGIVYAFEPDSETYAKISKNVLLNGFANIELFHTALGARDGSGQLYRLYENNPGANRILPGKQSNFVSSETVKITTLDEYYDRGTFQRADLIKIDVEGFELFVLQGARKLISHWKPLLFIELVDQNLETHGCYAQAVIGYLADMGYTILDARNMRPLEPSDRYYTDIFCVPKSSVETYV